jgi:sensor histidine kinase YesM
VNELAQRRLGGGSPVSVGELLFASGDWLLYAFLTPAVFVLSRRWPLSRPHAARHAGIHLAISLVFCAAWAGAGTILRLVLTPKAMWFPPGKFFISWLFITFPFGVAVYLAIVGIEHAIRYFEEARAREVQLARLGEQLSTARFAALQAQLNPHFLFNTLNTIAVLVREGDRVAAARMVEQLGDMLRRTLTRHRTNEVRLEEELELVRQYLAIEQARFSDRLRPELEVDETLRAAAVPSFALQHLVENAIRHGIARRSEAGRIRVAARRDRDMLELAVIDDGPGFDETTPIPRGHGIDNTRERLRALYGDRGSLVITRAPTGGTIATLRILFRDLD